ncbi:MAG: nucleotidyltransferase family protein [Chloroflexi bacterium]|nr:nucleotidyltransferase family protein [Chloroflexota bacterium]
MPETTAILLAAGESRRMGELKALLPWQGQSLISHQVSALAAGGVDRIIVVLGYRQEELLPEIEGKPGVEWALNPDYLQGKTTSIKAGLAALGGRLPEALLLLNVDQPRGAETVAYLLRQHRSNGPLITIPTFEGKGGHPVVFDGALVAELGAITEETQGIREVVRRHQEGTLRVEMESAEVLWDLNTPEQYRAALNETG